MQKAVTELVTLMSQNTCISSPKSQNAAKQHQCKLLGLGYRRHIAKLPIGCNLLLVECDQANPSQFLLVAAAKTSINWLKVRSCRHEQTTAHPAGADDQVLQLLLNCMPCS
jgi:hypothetical protein